MQDMPASVADALAAGLHAAGVRRTFGIPGGGTTRLVAALHRAGVEFLLCHQEAAAAYMGSVEAERSGVPGVALASLGPGAAAVVNGLAHCLLDRVALLVITDRLDDAADLPGYHQRLDHAALLRETVKASLTVTPRAASAVLEHALRLATAAPAGPVHLDLPAAVADAAVADASAEPAAGGRCSAGSRGPLDAPVVAAGQVPPEVRQLLRDATRPVILAGLGARSVAGDAVGALAASLRAPVLTTYKAKGVVDERSPWSGGLVTGGRVERGLLGAADLIVSIGLDDVELLPPGAAIAVPRVTVTAVPERPGVLPPPAAELVGHVGAATAALACRGRSRWTPHDAGAHRRAVDDELARAAAGGGDDAGLHPWRVARVVAELFDRHADVTVDAGAHMLPVTQAWRARTPGRFWISNGLSTMGYALPAAVALSSADPDRLVVCTTGDGGLLMVAGELATAARLARRLVIVVFDDGSLSLIRVKQRPEEAGRGVDFSPPDWASVAAGFGLRAACAGDEATLRRALHEAADRPLPTLVAVRVDGRPYGPMLRVLRGA